MRISSAIVSFAKFALALFLVLAAPGAFGQDKAGHEGHAAPLPPKAAPGKPAGPAAASAETVKQNEAVPVTIKLSPEKRQLIGVRTTVAAYRSMHKMIRTVGKVDVDETRLAYVNTKIAGWVTKLYVDYTGKEVKKGQPLLSLYSPDLVTAQEEYLLALRARRTETGPEGFKEVAEAQDTLLESARRRLQLWDITGEQIEELERTGAPRTEMTIFAPSNGIVLEKMVLDGAYIMPGMNLYKIADLSRVWVLADIYEYELSFIVIGQKAQVTTPYLAGRRFHATLSYIYPTLDPMTRTVKVRLEMDNPGLMFKTEMFTNVEIAASQGRKLTVPVEAVLDSGARKVLYVEKEPGTFELREVRTGVRTGDLIEIVRGVKAGEKVVTSGNFLIDSETQLRFGTGGGHQH